MDSGKTGPCYSPENNSSLPFRHIIPRRGIVRAFGGGELRKSIREENIGTKELEGQKDTVA